MVIVPRDDLLSFLYPSRDGYSSKHDGTTVQTLIQYLASASLRAPSSPVYVQNMVQLCDTAWTDWVDGQGKHYARKAALDGETMQKVLQTVVQLGQTEMFEKYAARHQGALSPNFFRWVRDWLRLGDPDQDSAMKRFEDVRNG